MNVVHEHVGASSRSQRCMQLASKLASETMPIFSSVYTLIPSRDVSIARPFQLCSIKKSLPVTEAMLV